MTPSTAALVPSATVSDPAKGNPAEPCIKSNNDDMKVPIVSTTPLSAGPILGENQDLPIDPKESLGERFHHWMETDLEHGL